MYELKIYRGVICHDNEEWIKIWRRIALSVQNWLEEFDESLPEHSLNFKGLLLTKVYNVSAKKVHRSYVWCQSGFMQNLKKNWITLSKMTWGIWQKKSDFILQSKMAELNQNQSSKQSDWLDAVWKLYFTLEINE